MNLSKNDMKYEISKNKMKDEAEFNKVKRQRAPKKASPHVSSISRAYLLEVGTGRHWHGYTRVWAGMRQKFCLLTGNGQTRDVQKAQISYGYPWA